MEIRQNRYGQDRVIEKISPTKIRVMGESLFGRTSTDENGNLIMFDFEGGPCLMVDTKINYLKSSWNITKITREESSQNNLVSILLEVELSN
jgi:hypothetical protein